MKKHKLLLLLVFGYLFFILPVYAGTAGLYLAPASGNYAVGQSFSVKVYVVTGGEYINAVAANLSYPASLLEATGVSTNGSFITIWAEKSAADGSVRLSGGLPTPGFSGEGLVATVNFRVKAKGAVSVNFTEGTVVVRDSDNQNILTSKFGADFSLTEAAESASGGPTATSVPTKTEVPSPTPIITLTPAPTETTEEELLPTVQPPTLTLVEKMEKEEKVAKEQFSFFSFFLGFVIATLLWSGGIGVYFSKKNKAS